MRTKTKWLLLAGLASSSFALFHCVGDEPSTSGGDDGGSGSDSGAPDNFVPPGDSGQTADAGSDASTACSAAAAGITCGPGVNPCIVQLAGGGQTFCGRDTDCNLYCWGDNRDGQLATSPATKPFSATPLKIDLGGRLSTGVDVGGEFDPNVYGETAVCSRVAQTLGTASTVACWGANRYGQLGTADAGAETDLGGFPMSSTPVPVAGLSNVATVLVSGMHTCAITATASGNVGVFDCWGNNNHGELGRTTTGPSDPNPGPSGATPGSFQNEATVGYQHTCVVNASNHVLCVGNNDVNQLGNDAGSNQESAATYATVTGLTADAISAAGKATCVLQKSAGDRVACWGDNAFGELGNGTTETSNPIPAIPPALPPSSAGGVQGGARNFCANFGYTALGDGGFTTKVYCWGVNDVGETVVPTDGGDVHDATMITNLPNGKVIHLVLAAQASCALMDNGTVWCWGSNRHGILGNRGAGGDDGAVLPPGQVAF